MKYFSILVIVILCCVDWNKASDRPVIGILDISTLYEGSNKASAFLHAQYVKFVEQAGALTVPIHFNNTFEETEYLMNHINGALFTGGALLFEHINQDFELIPYTITAKHIFEKAMDLNDNGVTFPIWGTCMGIQLMTYLVHGSQEILNITDSGHKIDPLDFQVSDPKKTQLFADFPEDLLEKVRKEALTANFHTVSVLTDRFVDPKNNLIQFYDLLATSYDRKGVSYVANIEAKKYPFFGSQYHPEVTEFTYSYNFLNHSDDARDFSYFLADKFVGVARQNNQSFNTFEEVAHRVIQASGEDHMGETSGGEFYDNYYFDFSKTIIVSE